MGKDNYQLSVINKKRRGRRDRGRMTEDGKAEDSEQLAMISEQCLLKEERNRRTERQRADDRETVGGAEDGFYFWNCFTIFLVLGSFFPAFYRFHDIY